MTAQEKFSALVALIRRYDDVAVAFSGGTKSSLLLSAAHEAHGSRIWALTANTPFFTQEELYRVHEVLDEYKLNSERVAIPELLDEPGIQALDKRCGACGAVLLKRMMRAARGVGASVLLSGRLYPYEAGGCSFCGETVDPFIELCYTRQDVEEMLGAIGRRYYVKPPNDCLACRFLGGSEIAVQTLDFIERAERYIRRYTRGEMKVCIDGDRAFVYSVEGLTEEAKQDVERELIQDGAAAGIAKIEFFGM